MRFKDYNLQSDFCFASTNQDSCCEFLSKSYCFVGLQKLHSFMGLDTSAHWHIVSPSILSINQKMETISIVSRYYYPCSFVTLSSNLKPKFSRLSCKLHIVWTFLWIQNWKPMQILQLFQPLDWPPHERSFCCLCHLCHNHSFQLPLPPEWVLWLLGISLTVDEFILVQILLCLSALVALL